MQKKRLGIVLCQLGSPHKIALLDQMAGRVDGMLVSSVCVGALVSYTIDKERGTFYYLTHLDIVSIPFAIARSDILFWHHVLELCYYFVPQGSFTHQLFELLEFLYTVDIGVCWCMRSKKIYLFKLLILIGVYTKLPKLSLGQIQHLQALPLDMIADEVIDEQTEKMLDEWLRACVYEHPAIEKFNTVYFLLSK